jgi:hypothetical protein
MRVLVPLGLVASGLLAAASPSAAQAASGDTSAAEAASGDTSAVEAASGDTSAAQPSDSVRPAADSAPAAPVPLPPPAPVDRALKAACGPLEAPSLAPDLLVIVFNPETDGPARTAVARSVRGKLAGPTGSGDGDSYYLKVPAKGTDYLLGAIADRLIGRPEVRQVGATVCPRIPAPPPPRLPAEKAE